MDRAGRQARGCAILLGVLALVPSMAAAQVETGACCFLTDDCQELGQPACEHAGGTWLGPGTVCTPNPCVDPEGACCLPDGSCEMRSDTECATGQGTYQGDGTVCTPDPCPQPICVVEPDTLDFGVVLLGSFAERTVTITNTGGGVLSGTLVESCADFSIAGDGKFTLGPTDSEDFTLRFAPTVEGASACEVDAGLLCGPITLQGVGEALPECLVEVPGASDLTLAFGDVLVGESADLQFTITNTGGGLLSGQVTESCPHFSLVGSTIYELGANQSKSFTVRFAPTVEGPLACTISTGADCDPVEAGGNGIEPALCVVTPLELDFGNVAIGESRDRIFTIRNDGGGVLDGTVSEDCPEFSLIGDRSYSLGPGESQVFTLRFSPTDIGQQTCLADAGLPCPTDVEAVGVGEPAPECLVTPSALDFGIVAIDQAVDLTFTIENTGGGMISGAVSEPCAAYSIIGPTSYVLTAGQSQIFTLRFRPGLPGPQNCTVDTGCLSLPVTGTGAFPAECDLDPLTLAFGAVVLGTSAERTIQITNLGDLPLRGTVVSPCPELVIEEGAAYDLGPGASQTVRVRFSPSRVGDFACTLDSGTIPGPGTIACGDIPVNGRGVAPPECELSTTELDFGNVLLGSNASLPLLVTNVGGDTLRGEIVVPCSEFLLEGVAAFELSEGASHSVSIRFTPAERGAVACTLDVGSCGPVFTRGNGLVSATCLVEPDTLDFGGVQLGESAERSFQITNLGEAPLTGTLTESCSEFAILDDPVYTLGSAESRVFSVRFTPALEQESSCVIDAGDLCVPITSIGTGLGSPLCSVSLESFDFGLVPVGESREQEIRIENVGGGVLEGDVSASCNGFSVEGLASSAGALPYSLRGALPYSLRAGESFTFRVIFAPLAAGGASCEIDLGTACPVVGVHGIGDPPPLCFVSATRLDLGSVVLGSKARGNFTIRNVGGQRLIGEVEVDCPELGFEGDTKYSLAAQESLGFAVVFAPVIPGAFACQVTLGAGCDPIVVVARGVLPPECAVSTLLIDFGEVPVGQTAERNLTVSNIGESLLEGTLSLECGSAQLKGDPSYALGAAESKVFVVEFAPLQIGSIECEIEIGSGCPPVGVRGAARAPLGACCFSDGSCIMGSEADCRVAGGEYLGDATLCDLDACALEGACCFADGRCEMHDARDCARLGGTGWTEGVTCDDATCIPIGACCPIDGSCSVRAEADCLRREGTYQGDGSVCEPETCPVLGACCHPDGGCELLEEGLCFERGGSRWAVGIACGEADCAPLGACCAGGGDCVVVTEAQCHGDYLGDGVPCDPGACLSIGACCDATGRCSIVLEEACNGSFLGDGVACTPDPCAPKVQAVTVLANGAAAELQVQASSGLRDLEGWYRVGGTISYKQIPSFFQRGAVWVGAFDIADLNLRGIEFYLTYLDMDLGLRVSHGEADRPRRLPIPAAVTVPTLEPLTLRMLSAPLEVEDPAGVLGKLRELFGEPGLRTWLLGRWDPAAARYRYLGIDETEAFVNGASYFLGFAAPQDAWSIDGRTHFPVADLVRLTLPLAPGWNMIGNPVGYALGIDPERVLIGDGGTMITFSAARAGGNPRVSDLYVYDPTLPADDPNFPYRVTPPILAPWEGCWIENRRDHELVLAIPSIAADATALRESEPGTAGGDGWLTTFRATSASTSGAVTLGAMDDASNDLDPNDLLAPPAPPGARVHLSIEGLDPLLRDVRALDARGADGSVTTWTLTLALAEDADLAWSSATVLGASTQQRLAVTGPWLFLREPASGREIDLSSLGSIRLPAGVHRLDVEARLAPASEMDKTPGFVIEPNPTHAGALVRYSIDAMTRVGISVFNAAGSRIWSSASSQGPGAHAILWNGCDERGDRVPAGTYFVRLEVGGRSRSARVIVVR